MTTRTELSDLIKDALNHLYDPDHLHASPLARAFGVADRYDTPAALRRVLTEAIEALEPGADEPSHSRAWRMHEILRLRHVEQLAPSQVAEQLNISERQLRRDQRAELQLLCDYLWDHYHLGTNQDDAQVQPENHVGQETIQDELSWLRNGAQGSTTDLDKALTALLELATILGQAHGARLQVRRSPDLPTVSIHPVAFRQIMLNLLTAAMARSPGNDILLSVQPNRWLVHVTILSHSAQSCAPCDPEQQAATLNMAQQIAQLSDCHLDLTADGCRFEARLQIPALEQCPVLLIDDNLDTHQLIRRYLSGTRYRLYATQDPEQAIELAAEMQPEVVVLDVMMPQVDGWEILARLRQHPTTSQRPIIVCTILAQQDLAQLLGASGFVRKPITRQALLTALDDLACPMASIPH